MSRWEWVYYTVLTVLLVVGAAMMAWAGVAVLGALDERAQERADALTCILVVLGDEAAAFDIDDQAMRERCQQVAAIRRQQLDIPEPEPPPEPDQPASTPPSEPAPGRPQPPPPPADDRPAPPAPPTDPPPPEEPSEPPPDPDPEPCLVPNPFDGCLIPR